MPAYIQAVLGIATPTASLTGVLAPFDIDADNDLDLIVGWVGPVSLDENGNVIGQNLP